MKKLFLFSVVLVSLQAQRVKKLDGDVAELTSVKKMNVVFTYNDVTVGKYTEADYIAKKVEEYNKKEPGRGEKWRDSWENDKPARFQPQFIELFEKNCDFAIGKYPTEKYTMTINTSRIEPGFNIYITRKNAEIDIEVKITETATKRLVAEYKMTGAPGRTFGGNDFDTGTRIEESYAKAGKEMGRYIQKEMGK
jgi:hypothetical protein